MTRFIDWANEHVLPWFLFGGFAAIFFVLAWQAWEGK